jgi:uncharacterized repeat protein (TIGR01451 family)
MRSEENLSALKVVARTATMAVALMGAAPLAWTQTYEISWWTADAGGFTAVASPGLHQLWSTAGQPDAGGPYTGATFVVHSGFWGLVAGGAGGPQADVAATVTNGQATSVPGTTVTYTMTVTNAGPNAAAGVWIFNTVAPLSLLNVTWTCTASPGSSCPASGNNTPNHFVDVAIGGALTYVLTGTHQTALTGNFDNTITATVPSGMTDPNLANNSAVDTDLMTPHADLALTISDTPDPVGPGLQYIYRMTLANSGPSYSYGNTVTQTLPAGVTFGGWDTNAPLGSCVHASGTVTCDMPQLDVAETQTIRVRATPLATTTGVLTSSASVLGDDFDPLLSNNADVETTLIAMQAEGELTHGARVTADLAALGGVSGVSDADFYRIRQEPRSSYEVVLDAAGGDSPNPELRLLEADGLTVVAGGGQLGTGASRSMRWMNDTTSTLDDQFVRVRSGGDGCQAGCGPDDQYRLRLWDTTGVIPRYNSTGSQITVVIVQNATPDSANVRMYFWDPSGALLFRQAVFMSPFSQYSLNTNGFVELQNTSGSITIASDAPLGAIVAKAVSLEPSTGFSFDSPMTTRPR